MKQLGTSPVKLQRRVTLKDIAERLELSHSTVSRALNRTDDPFISELTRVRVREAAASMGYRPNIAARGLVTGRTGLLALWLWSQEDPGAYHASVSQLMHEEASGRNYQLVVDYVGTRTLNRPAGSAFDSTSVDGIIAHESSPALRTRFPQGAAINPPIVATGAYNLLEGVDRVVIDLNRGSHDAMRHLLGQGYRRIAYMTHELEKRTHDPRYIAYLDAMKAHDLPLEFIPTGHRKPQARQAIREYVADQGAPEAILCHNDDIALGTYRGLCDIGISVSDQVALVGCDGIEDCEYLETPISSIKPPLAEMCAIATQLLEQRIEDPTRPLQEVCLHAELVIRASSCRGL